MARYPQRSLYVRKKSYKLNPMNKALSKYFKKNNSKAGKARWEGVSAKERSRIMKKVRKARTLSTAK